jgi:hypothetical protein
MTKDLEAYRQALANLLFVYRDGPAHEEARLIDRLDALWYRLSVGERAIADDFSRRVASGEVSEEQFYWETFPPERVAVTAQNIFLGPAIIATHVSRAYEPLLVKHGYVMSFSNNHVVEVAQVGGSAAGEWSWEDDTHMAYATKAGILWAPDVYGEVA